MLAETKPDLSVADLHKSFGEFKALDGIGLDAQKGEFVVLLGPSGCGKTTLLRSIAGLEKPDRGQIRIGGRNVSGLRPKDRNVAMVFQNYALYPFMTVAENIGFGLRMRGIGRADREKAVNETAQFLGLDGLLQRYPRQLSGGQRQRVAMGRAVVRRPTLFLFDEPLSNLDAQLRDDMRTEIKRLHGQLNTTAVYVTHDQIEAMTLADRIILMRDGRIEQAGPPRELYRQPANLFVASFIGSPKINLIDGVLTTKGKSATLKVDGHLIRLPASSAKIDGSGEQSVIAGVRPEHIRLAGKERTDPQRYVFSSEVIITELTGSRLYADFELAGAQIRAEVDPDADCQAGAKKKFQIDTGKILLFDAETKRRLGE